MSTQVADPLLGSLVDGRYRIRSRVARGGMATVYTAADERLERTVALKIIRTPPGSDAGAARWSLDRFTDEAKTVARLTHPNVVAVYDQGTHQGMPYLVLEYVRGRTLRDILAERRRLTPIEALAMLEQVLAALGAAHQAGLVHRDVKPENVLVAEAPSGESLIDAVAKVADFGLARAAETAEDADASHLLATVAYVAPEVVAEGYADSRSDVYSAGIMLFEMLTGRVPYDGERPVDVAWQHVDRDVPPPSRFAAGLPPLLDDLVAQATRRDPDARPADAAALLSAVQSAREAIASSSVTQQMRPIAQPTVMVNQVTDRPSWARLPSAQTKARPRVPAPRRSVGDQVRYWHRRVTSTQRGRIGLAAALAVLLVLVLTGGWWFAFGRYDVTPNLHNMTKEQALQQADLAGLELEFDAGEFREDIAKDIVLRQNPAPGQRVVKGGVITITLSKGPERYLVPNVVGKAYELAAADLAAEPYRLQVTKGADQFDDTVPAGMVLATNPPVGSEVKPGGEIEIILSKGRAPITIPAVVNKHVTEARKLLEDLGLKVTTEYVESDLPYEFVVEQDPQGGSSAEPGDEVLLKISNNPTVGVMPHVEGRGCQDAVNELHGMGFTVEIEGNVFDQQFGDVRRQEPKAGEAVAPGDTVKIRCRWR